MATTTARFGLTKPDPGDTVDVTQINADFDTIDTALGFTPCTSTTRPSSPHDGQGILESDTLHTYVWSAAGSAWEPIGPPSSSGAGIPISTATAKGDLLVATASASVTNLPVGTNGQVLTADSTQATGVQWSTGSGGGIPASTATAKGDLLVASASATVGRLGVGSDGQVLTADSTQTGGVKWAASSTTVFDNTVQALGSSGTTLTLNAASVGAIKTITLTANCTFTLTGATAGTAATLELILTQDGTGGRTVTWPASVKWAGGAPTLTVTAGAVDRVVLTSYNGGTTWYGDVVGLNYA